MSKNEIVKSSFFAVLQIIVTSFTYLVIYVLVLSRLGKEQLGVWSIITAIPMVVSFLGSGVSGSLLRFIPIHAKQGEQNEINKLIVNGLLFNFILGLSIVGVALIFTNKILQFMFGMSTVPSSYKLLFHCTLITFLFTFVGSVTLAALDGLKKIPLKNKILIFSSISFCLVASLAICKFGLIGLIVAQLFQAILVFVLAFLYLQYNSWFYFSLKYTDQTVFKVFYTYGKNLQYISILNLLFEPFTKFFLNRYFGLGIVGTYDIVNRIVGQLRMLIVNAIQVIIPFVNNLASNQQQIAKLYQQSFRAALLFSCILFGGLLTAGFSLIYYFNKLDAVDFQKVVLYLVISNMVNILATPAYSIQLGTGRLKFLVIAQFLSTALNIVFYLLLGLYPNSNLMLMPTALAIIISSLYVILSFTRLVKLSTHINTPDIAIYIVSSVFPLACILVSNYYYNASLLVVLLVAHMLLILVLIIKNQFLVQLIKFVVAKNKNNG